MTVARVCGPDCRANFRIRSHLFVLAVQTFRRRSLREAYGAANKGVSSIRGFHCNCARGRFSRGSIGSREERTTIAVNGEHGANRFLAIQTQVCG
jgi:hypothetical protein